MFTSRSIRTVARASRNYSSAAGPAKETEINVPKIFGIAALAGVSIYIYRNTNSDDPAIKTTYFKQFEQRRANNRDNIRLDIDEKAHGRSYIFSPGTQRSTYKDFKPNLNYNLIPRHSPWGPQFGQGIKTDKLGPRKERPVMFAPAKTD
ncbi:hypothetical protein CAAN1_11S04720 [[Candida] anglica]|uniref:Uncharacterized protein n=1 Tax=[Candida] anglica TaxID=148631 RepID=A0ABP0EHT3_9ASCO